MRPNDKSTLPQLVFALVLFLTIVVVFQNCAGYQPGENPLYDQSASSTCIGVTCQTDLNAVQIQIMNMDPINLRKTSDGTVPTETCGISSCFEVAGYCDTAGYPGSVFFVEAPGLFAQTRTTASCTANGRFKITVAVPSTFKYANLYPLSVWMHVIDDHGVEHANPTGVHRKVIGLTGRIDPTPTPTP